MDHATGAFESAQQPFADLAGKYLTFTLAGEEYGIGILKVKEIIGLMPITPVPKAPHYVKGVINLRGKVIPIMDLRLKFGMEPLEYDERTCIIVVEVNSTDSTITMGLVVDSVSEVLNIRAEEIQETPSFGAQVDTEYILGMAKMDGKVKILLDIDKVLSVDQLQKMKDLA
ncbi:MAG: chemotaxis protein CheW [Deltaproteobacteria bacterium]|nr:MAG: chemotaxis protein CheW [Deltaproteobacteria bacterium]